MRRPILTLLAIAAVLLLQGCFKLNMDLKVNPDDTVDGSMIIAFNEEMYNLMDEEEKQEILVDEDVPENATVEEWAEDGMKGQKITFSKVSLDEFDKTLGDGTDDGAPRLYREGDHYYFTFKLDTDELTGGEGFGGGDEGAELGDDEMGDLDLEGMDDLFDEDFEKSMESMMKMMFKDAEVKIAVTFPGKIVETNGVVDGKTVTWDIDLTKTDENAGEMSAKAEVGSASDKVVGLLTGEDTSGFPIVPVVIGAILVLAVLGGGIAVARKRKGTPPPPPAPPAAPAA